jgi:hypothetical protein
MKTKEEIASEWYSHSQFRSDLQADYKSFLEGYQAAQEEMIAEINRRVVIIISEPNGIVRESMINNLPNL